MGAPDPGHGVPSDAWHQLASDEVVRRLGADARKGLTQAQVAGRRRRYGHNEIREGRKRGPAAMFLGPVRRFHDPRADRRGRRLPA